MSKPSAPKAPDYVAAAQAQGAANVDTARTSAKLSNPNIINPYGTQTVTYNGDIPTVTQSLNPVGQELLNQQNRISQGLGNLAEGGIATVGGMMSTPFDVNGLPARAQSGDDGWSRAYNAIVQRNQPLQERTRNALEAKLKNQGIEEGTEAWKNALDDQSRAENDFSLAAQQAATAQEQAQFGMDTQARQNALQEDLTLRQLPLNEINALRTGAQVNLPQFQGFQGQQVQAAPLFQAAQSQANWDQGQYNAQMAGANSITGGLFSLGGAGIMAF